MGFTRSTTNISVHQGLSDYPNQDDGLTAAQLKATFDFPAETLQNDLNGLETELEDVTSAANIGADVISEGDESDANVQAKLEKLYTDIQNVSQGTVPDGSITQAKLASSLTNTLGYKDGTLQTDLNAEKVGGSTLAQIQALISGTIVTGTYTGNTTNSTTTNTITLGFEPKFLAIRGYYNVAGSSDNNAVAIIIGTKGKILRNSSLTDIEIATSSTGFTLTGKDMNYSSKTYTYVALR